MEAAIYLSGLLDRPVLKSLLIKMKDFEVGTQQEMAALVPFLGPRDRDQRRPDLETMTGHLRHLAGLIYSSAITDANADDGLNGITSRQSLSRRSLQAYMTNEQMIFPENFPLTLKRSVSRHESH